MPKENEAHLKFKLFFLKKESEKFEEKREIYALKYYMIF